MLCPEALTSFISSYQESQRAYETSRATTCTIGIHMCYHLCDTTPAWSSNLLWPWSYLLLLRDIQHHFDKVPVTLEPQIILIFLLFCPACLFLCMWSPITPTPVSDTISIRLSDFLGGNRQQLTTPVTLASLRNFTLLNRIWFWSFLSWHFFILPPFSSVYWIKNNGGYQWHVQSYTSLQSP